MFCGGLDSASVVGCRWLRPQFRPAWPGARSKSESQWRLSIQHVGASNILAYSCVRRIAMQLLQLLRAGTLSGPQQ